MKFLRRLCIAIRLYWKRRHSWKESWRIAGVWE